MCYHHKRTQCETKNICKNEQLITVIDSDLNKESASMIVILMFLMAKHANLECLVNLDPNTPIMLGHRNKHVVVVENIFLGRIPQAHVR